MLCRVASGRGARTTDKIKKTRRRESTALSTGALWIQRLRQRRNRPASHERCTPARSLCQVLVVLYLVAVGQQGVAAPLTEQAAERTVAEATLLERIMTWLPGDYSNAGTMPPGHRGGDAAAVDKDMNTLTTYIRPVTMPDLGAHVLFLEEYRGTAAPVLERVRLYRLAPGADAGVVEMLVINPKSPEDLRGARNDLPRVESLTAEELNPDSPGCRLTFREGLAGYVQGKMDYQGCRFRQQWVDYEIHLGSSDHWICYSRRQQATDAVVWQLVPGHPCIHMLRQ